MSRWHLSIPDGTDRAVRTFLARTGGRKGDLSRFVDDAVRRLLLDLTLADIKARNAGYDQQEILDLIGQAFPLDLKVPNSRTRAATAEAEEILKAGK